MSVTVVAYLPVFKAGFINLDDTSYVTENKMVQGGLSWSGLNWALTTGDAANWHPLTWLSHMLDWQILGPMQAAITQTNLLFHTLNSVLLLFLGEHYRSRLAQRPGSGHFRAAPRTCGICGLGF